MKPTLNTPVSSLLLVFLTSSLGVQHHRRHGHGALYPEAVNLASLSRGVSIWSNGTCGERGPETYCKLRGSGCSVCDSSRSDKRHPAELALDGDSSTWWQSSTLQASHKYHYVTITIDLKQVYQVLYVRIRSGNSPRPANWILERSLDGENFSPWQFFAASDDLCWARYSIKPSPPHPHKLSSDSEVICTSAYSKVTPVEGGEMHVSLSAGRAGSNSSSKEWTEFTKARYIRLRFQRLGSSKQRHNHEMSKRYYYSIRDILVQGRCLCHGHAQFCPFDSLTKKSVCKCEHNTCGADCSWCCPKHHQVGWRQATQSRPHQCGKCQCHGHASDCFYDPLVAAAALSMDTNGRFHGGGVCINCTKHTGGVNCQRCEEGWYRPLGVRPDASVPCLPCDCHSVGSTGSCIRDDSEAHLGKIAGWCKCKEGYTGSKCDECASGYRGFPDCRPCQCNSSGMLPASSCDTNCLCKRNVEGERCERCKDGYFFLDQDNPDGCTACYCSGVSSRCTEAHGFFLREISTMDGWVVSDVSGSLEVIPYRGEPGSSMLSVAYYQLSGVESYYWLAPPPYGGNKLTSYGSTITFTLSWDVMRGDTSGKPTIGPDLILVGENGLRIGYGETWHNQKSMSITVQLVEEGWYHVVEGEAEVTRRGEALRSRREQRGADVTRHQFLSVLANIKRLLVRAKFHSDQAEGSLESCMLEMAEQGKAGSSVGFLEECFCPEGYVGLSCEGCDYGYARVEPDGSSLRQHAVCSKCNCHSHAPTCDPNTGQCTSCEHFTYGTECEMCLAGYYGDATQGTREDCKRCACPLLTESNNFSPTCEADSVDYVCTACPPGYTGRHCDRCDEGYYGEPREVGSKCEPCDCGDGPCDPITGLCLSCHGNREGKRCERCKPQHYSPQPLSISCLSCACDPLGSESNECDEVSGQCPCKDSFTGRACDRCQTGFGNVSAGCVPCKCDALGAVSSLCDAVSGACLCQPGVTGDSCDECLPAHYAYSSSGCKRCNCHIDGSTRQECEFDTGQCQCKENVVGLMCDSCRSEYWGLMSGLGCEPCNCDSLGSQDQLCDYETGQCSCKPGVGGLKCDRCMPLYYGFSSQGCLECEVCELDGHICDPDTGKCICPPYTSGPDCSVCVHNSWGFTPGKGCKACNCDQHGSLTQHCDASTGRCSCREGYTGAKCESCARGWYGYPRCMRCDCSLAGTHSQHCANGICVCDENGQCPCKSHVVGKQCDRCREGSFGLSREDPHGCTPCFCFGRSTNCTSAGLVWSQIHMSRPRSLTVSYDNDTSSFLTNTFPVNTQEICYINLAMPGMNGILKKKAKHLNVTNHLRLIPDDEGDVELGVTYLWDSPVYWQLPKTFLGDKVLSYGGYLRFTVETEGGTTLMPPSVLSSYPLIQIQGNDRVVLEHFPIYNPSNYFQVRFHESLWKNKNNPEARVSRETLMIALQNLQHILIRASDSVDFQVARLRELTMDTAVENKGAPFPNAIGIELCDCPKTYNSTSCQDPSIGFFRERHPSSNPSSTIIIELVGEATPCQCNGRSSLCHIETGHCIGCANNTGGKHCEDCAEGFYGDANSAMGCKPCPCPSTTNNFASSCQVLPDGEAICVCKPGYSGFRCDSCSYGWFGYPKVEGGGGCKMCKCNPYGSVSDECHEEKGQCNCKVNITGRDCSQCINPRQVLRDSRGCLDCDDECVKLLLDSVDGLASHFERSTRHIADGLLAPPWETLVVLDSETQDLVQQFELKRKVTLGYDQLSNYLDTTSHHVKNILNKSKKLNTKNDNMLDHVFNLEKETDAMKSMLDNTKKEISLIMKRLSDYISSEGEEINISAMILEAKQLLNTIRDRDLEPLRNQSNRALRKCTNILKELKYIVSETNEAEYLEKRLQRLSEKNDHLLDIISNIDKTVEMIKLKNNNFKNSTEMIEKMFSSIIGVEGSTEDLLNESRLLNNIAQVYIAEAQDNFDALLELKDLLKNGQKVLRKRINNIMIDDLNVNYVIPARHYAISLQNVSRGYDREFQADLGLVMQATKAYDEIINTVASAKEDAIMAKESAEEAFMLAYPGGKDESVAETVALALNASTALRGLAENQLNVIMDLEQQHDRSMASVIQTSDFIKTIDMDRQTLSRQIDSLVNQASAVKASAKETISGSEEVMELAEGIQDNVTYLVYNIQTKLKPELDQMALDNELNINAAEHIVNKAQGNARKSHEMVSNLLHNMKKNNDFFQQWNSSVAAKLEELRDQITQARHMASSIPLSITSIGESGGGGSCVRTYTPTHLEPSTMTSIMLTYAISSNLRDALLFYLPSSSTEDFVAIEMVNRKMRFVWNVGGGLGQVIHPLHIQTAGDLTKDQHWYKVEAQRMSNVGRLWVKPVLVSEGSPLRNQPPATNSSAAGIGRLDVGPGDRVWVGGADRVRHPHLLSKHSGLVGCLHQLHLNDRPIGLWDFRTQNPFSCTACIQGAEEIKDETSYTFSGDGYVALHQDSTTAYNKYLFSVSFAFRTFDFSALLFLAVGTHKEKFISLSLSEGKVIFRIGYGEDSILEMSTLKKYNNGNWTRVEASRYFDRNKKIEKGLLKVGEEVREGAPTPPPGQDSIPDLSSADYYVGGLPPGELPPPAAPPPLPFLGCMSHVQIAQDEYNLLKARYWGVQPACSDKPISVAGFFGNGYLELGSHNLRKGGGFSFVFSTSDRDTLLLLSTFQKGGEVSNYVEPDINDNLNEQLSYYSVSLRRGQVDVRLNGGRGEVRLASMSSEYADSKFHSIAITKIGRRVELRVDDVLDAATTLPEGSNVIRSPGAKGGLFLGGLPKTFNTTGSTYSSQPLVGTIKDLIINNKVIGMEHPVSFEEVAIGRFGPESSRGEHSASGSRGATACRKVSSYSLEPGAVKFGDSANSHIQINLRKRSLLQKNFSLELNFRTFYPNGLLFIVPGVKGKQPHYLMASLRSGRVSIAVKGKRKIETTGQVVFNDGAWHHMVLQRQDRKMMLKVDSVDPGKTKTPKKMNLGSSLFIGGVPDNGIALPPQLVFKLEGFKGCIRDLKLNMKTEDLVGDKATPYRIGQCFPQVERGSFFPGDAFAIYNNKFDVGELVELELEFRTSELNGILLSISEPDGYPSLTLELHNGKVVLGGDNGDRRPYKVELSLSSEFAVCDNRWHRVQALYIGDEITLRVDNVDTKYWLSDNGHLTEAHTNSPLYIGGLPEYAPSSTLMLRENFRGCIRGVIINGERRDWIDMAALHNILLSSCPLTN